MLETNDMEPQKVDPHLTTRIVRSYVKHHTVGADQVSELITAVHRALGQLGHPVQPQEVLTPAVLVRQSVRHDQVVCLDCGCRAKMLRRHISTRHALSPDESLKRWGLPSNHPLIAPAYSEQRSTMAKALGLGRKSNAEVASAAAQAVRVSADADPSPGRSLHGAEAPVPHRNQMSRVKRRQRMGARDQGGHALKVERNPVIAEKEELRVAGGWFRGVGHLTDRSATQKDCAALETLSDRRVRGSSSA